MSFSMRFIIAIIRASYCRGFTCLQINSTDYCPEYNTEANAINVIPCNSSTGCPDVLFLSNQVYRCKYFQIYKRKMYDVII